MMRSYLLMEGYEWVVVECSGVVASRLPLMMSQYNSTVVALYSRQREKW